MATSPGQSPPLSNETMAGEIGAPVRTGRLSEDERDALRARARQARSDAAAAAAVLYASMSAEVARLQGASDRQHAALLASRQDLEAATSQFARLLKALDTPPERALTLLKEAVAESVPQHNQEGRAIMEDVVRWGVRAFYEGMA